MPDSAPLATPLSRVEAFVKRHWQIAVLLLVLASGGVGIARLVLGPSIKVYVVERGNIVQTVVASGRVEAPLRVEVGSQVTGSVLAVPVDEGQFVKTGQTLIQLDDTEVKAAVAQAQSAVAQAEARLKQLRDTDLPVAEQSLRQARATLLNTQQQFERTSKLFRDGFVGKSQLDDAQRALDVAESQVKSSEIQVASNRPGGSNAAIAETALAQALASLRTAQARLGYATITAPTDGTLITRDVERGNVVQPGKVLMTLSPAGTTQLVVDIDEKNLAYLAVGQKALGSADAYPNQTFPAELVYINPGVDPLRGSVEVKLGVPSPPAYLLQDMTVSVDIEVARHRDVLTIPAEAVHDSAGPNPWTLVVRGNRVQRQPVKVTARGESRIEVGEGLQAGDLVVPATNADVTDGQRVRPRIDGDRARST